MNRGNSLGNLFSKNRPSVNAASASTQCPDEAGVCLFKQGVYLNPANKKLLVCQQVVACCWVV